MMKPRYTDSIDPVRTDGRDIDPALGTLLGEGSGQRVSEDDRHLDEITPQPWSLVPSVVSEDPTYFDRPLLKRPVWEPVIPAYFYVGGTAGAALTLGAAAQLSRDRRLSEFVRHCHWIGVAGSTIGAVFLIYDLGRPERFLHMMRVFRPSSPMNVGTWILMGAAPMAITAALFARKGPLRWLGELAGYASGPFGAALAGYTGVLVSNSSIPVWSEGRRTMPFLFIGSAMTSAASLLDLYFENAHAARITFMFGTAGRMLELAAGQLYEHELDKTPGVALPLRAGRSGQMYRAATLLTAASLVCSLIPVKSRWPRRVAGVLGTAGSILLRFAIYEIGKASAADPRASFHLQRRNMQG